MVRTSFESPKQGPIVFSLKECGSTYKVFYLRSNYPQFNSMYIFKKGAIFIWHTCIPISLQKYFDNRVCCCPCGIPASPMFPWLLMTLISNLYPRPFLLSESSRECKQSLMSVMQGQLHLNNDYQHYYFFLFAQWEISQLFFFHFLHCLCNLNTTCQLPSTGIHMKPLYLTRKYLLQGYVLDVVAH